MPNLGLKIGDAESQDKESPQQITDWSELERIIIKNDTCISPLSSLRSSPGYDGKFERAKADFEGGKVFYYQFQPQEHPSSVGYIRLLHGEGSVFLDYITPPSRSAFAALKKLAKSLSGQFKHFYVNPRDGLINFHFGNLKKNNVEVKIRNFPTITSQIPKNEHTYELLDIMD